MKSKLKIIPIKSIKFDTKLYPRIKPNFQTIARYYNALKSGSVFPPIALAKLGENYLLIDGKHRIEANRGMKQTHIQAEIYEGMTEQEIFIEAVKRNNIHGLPFSAYEVSDIILTLEKWNMSQEQISKIVRLATEDIKPFVAKRITRITGTQEDIVLKKPLQNLVGIDLNEEINQDNLSGSSQVRLIDNLIKLLNNNWLETSNKIIIEKLKTLYDLLNPYVIIEIEKN